MIIKVRKIGNSAGIILSKSMMEQCAIKDEVKIEIKGDSIIIQPVKKKPREGWEESFINAGSLTDHSTIIPNFSNNFDDEEWTW
jgi:antitoxin MazE